MAKDTFNMRNPDPNEVVEMHNEAKKRRAQIIKYKVIKDLMDGKDTDITVSPAIYEALNREKMDFEQILRLHPDQANEAMLAAKEDREMIDENKYWNSEGAKWGVLGHIPPCVYNSRPSEYWNNKKILKAFFNMYPKFRVSTRKI
jgi:hypothetical protein